jgi:hypothetical protein
LLGELNLFTNITYGQYLRISHYCHHPFFFAMLGIQPRALHMLGKISTTNFPSLWLFEAGSAQADLELMIFLP